MKILLLLSAVLFSGVFSSHRPDFFPLCKKDDPNLNECAKKAAIALLPYLKKGDPSLNVPQLTPLHLDELSFQASTDLFLHVTNVDLFGFDVLEYKEVELNLEKNYLHLQFALHEINVIGQYDMKGKISVLPLNGRGNFNVTMVIDDTVLFGFEWVKKKRHGVEYAQLVNPVLKLKPKKIYYYFQDIFQSDAAMSDHILNFMNENWELVWNDVSEGFYNIIEAVGISIPRGIFAKIPFNELFP